MEANTGYNPLPYNLVMAAVYSSLSFAVLPFQDSTGISFRRKEKNNLRTLSKLHNFYYRSRSENCTYLEIKGDCLVAQTILTNWQNRVNMAWAGTKSKQYAAACIPSPILARLCLHCEILTVLRETWVMGVKDLIKIQMYQINNAHTKQLQSSLQFKKINIIIIIHY